jgi:hypothetical protein
MQTLKLYLIADANFLLGCVRDDTIKVLDLRMNQIICSFRWVQHVLICSIFLAEPDHLDSQLIFVHYKHRLILKVNKLFRRIYHHSRCSNCLHSLDTSISSLSSVYVIVSQMLFLNKSILLGLLKYILLLNFPSDKNHRDSGLGTFQATICDLSVPSYTVLKMLIE